MPMNQPCLNPALMIKDQSLPIFDGSIHAAWCATAQAKGFTIVARVVDRYHLALRCDSCGGLTKTKLFVLMNNQPICAPCLAAKQGATARAAGVTLLRRDPTDRHYATYKLPCGHEARRQLGLLDRVAAGETDLRCELCLSARQSAEAAARGWALIGADPGGNINYRQYKHMACGAVQSVALANMKTGRFDCSGCGQSWSAAPSQIYAMRFWLADGEELVKLGYSKDPASRLSHQLLSGRKARGVVLRTVAMPTGAAAIRAEKALHKELCAAMPDAVIGAEHIAGRINVQSEVYHPVALPMIHRLLDRVAAQGGQAA